MHVHTHVHVSMPVCICNLLLSIIFLTRNCGISLYMFIPPSNEDWLCSYGVLRTRGMTETPFLPLGISPLGRTVWLTNNHTRVACLLSGGAQGIMGWGEGTPICSMGSIREVSSNEVTLSWVLEAETKLIRLTWGWGWARRSSEVRLGERGLCSEGYALLLL